jgi:hypothetical protein
MGAANHRELNAKVDFLDFVSVLIEWFFLIPYQISVADFWQAVAVVTKAGAKLYLAPLGAFL